MDEVMQYNLKSFFLLCGVDEQQEQHRGQQFSFAYNEKHLKCSIHFQSQFDTFMSLLSNIFFAFLFSFQRNGEENKAQENKFSHVQCWKNIELERWKKKVRRSFSFILFLDFVTNQKLFAHSTEKNHQMSNANILWNKNFVLMWIVLILFFRYSAVLYSSEWCEVRRRWWKQQTNIYSIWNMQCKLSERNLFIFIWFLHLFSFFQLIFHLTSANLWNFPLSGWTWTLNMKCKTFNNRKWQQMYAVHKRNHLKTNHRAN